MSPLWGWVSGCFSCGCRVRDCWGGGDGGGSLGAYSAKAVYIWRCRATAVGASWRRRSFSRGLVIHFHAIKLAKRIPCQRAGSGGLWGVGGGRARVRRTYLPKSVTRALRRRHSRRRRSRGAERREGLLAPVGMMNVSARVSLRQ